MPQIMAASWFAKLPAGVVPVGVSRGILGPASYRGAWLDGSAHRACARSRRAPPSGHRAVGSEPTFFTDPIFPTRFPTELLTTGWEMAPWNGQQPVKKAIFSGTKRHCKIQDNMGGNGLGNLCSSRIGLK